MHTNETIFAGEGSIIMNQFLGHHMSPVDKYIQAIQIKNKQDHMSIDAIGSAAR